MNKTYFRKFMSSFHLKLNPLFYMRLAGIMPAGYLFSSFRNCGSNV